MIRAVRGSVLSVEPSGIVIDVSGWGIFVHLASTAGFAPGTEAHLHTYLAVKQDGVDLYGFSDAEDLRFFELLLSVSGVGPKTALSILRRAPREALTGAIGKRDVTYLTRVVGLGKKTAEKILLEISEKMGAAATHDGDDTEVFDMLIALGYTEREARAALAKVPATIAGAEDRFRAALSASHAKH